MFDVFVLLRCMTILTLTFDFLTLRVFHVQCFSCPTPIPIFIILWLSVTELRVLNIRSHFRYLKQSLRMHRLTWPLTGGKNSPHFWNSWPQFAYSLCHFQGAMTIKPCCGQKIAFSNYEGYTVYCACAVSRDLCIGVHPERHVTIFWPWIAYLLYNFYGATMTIKGSFILEHPIKAVFGRKKK